MIGKCRFTMWGSVTMSVAAAMSGCSSSGRSTNMAMQKPIRPVQMNSLERFVGEWSGTAEMAPATAAKMKKAMPVSDTGKEMQTSFAGGSESRWVLDGMTLRNEGWFEMGKNQKKSYVEFWTWNANKGKYRIVMMDDWGGFSQGWATASDGGESFNVVMHGIDAQGNKENGSGTITFTDRNTMEWTWKMSGPTGKMEFVGTSKRSG